ncbi:MAG: hypothetical protein HXY30_09475 [Pseudorhodoplanes sp.]|nr:hypothetical protein [Pseudorhodoplanes sp.]
MQTLLTVLVAWLSANFALPADSVPPTIQMVSQAQMADIRYARLGMARSPGPAAEPERMAPLGNHHAVFAIYDNASRTIYLPQNWSGKTPREVSLLVHELVHHLQNAAGLKYYCPGEREKLAYQAQARWLEMFGKNIADEFELDPMTLLLRTNCLH